LYFRLLHPEVSPLPLSIPVRELRSSLGSIFDAGGNPTGDEAVGGAGLDVGWWALVAADDSEFWCSLRRELPELDQRLLTVHSGRDCLRAIEDRRIRLVVVDSSLKDVPGNHLAHLARRIRPDLGIVLTFSQSSLEQEREARQAGILYYGDRLGTREIAQVIRKALSRTPGGPVGDADAASLPIPRAVRTPEAGKAARPEGAA